jgi:histidine ammonia-lyase
LISKTKSKGSIVVLDGESLQIEDLVRIARDLARVEISDKALEKVRAGRKIVEGKIKSGKTAYGINTGFGRLADTRIDDEDLDLLQLNLIRSHSAGVGEPLPIDQVRALMAVRLNTLLRGFSGVREEIVQQLRMFLNADIAPKIPRYGSLGASGDLAPSAHLALALIGEGEVFLKTGPALSKVALSAKKIRPVKLKAKEGLAIINGTQVISGIGSLVVADAYHLLKILDVAAAVTLEALGGKMQPYDPRVHDLRPIRGQIAVAERIRGLTLGSKLVETGDRVQDPYSLRCVPQVHGAVNEAVKFAYSQITVEINSVTDNPLIFSDETVISAGNFHGQPVALPLDFLGIALAEAGSFSERRIDKLLSGFDRRLPLFLTKQLGLNSGMMILQYTAAALVNQNAVLATPAGLNSATVSAGQEDHASMGVTSALKANEILANATKILAIELICACQALDFQGPEKAGAGTKIAYGLVRKIVEFLESDRPMAKDIESLSTYLRDREFARKVFDTAS